MSTTMVSYMDLKKRPPGFVLTKGLKTSLVKRVVAKRRLAAVVAALACTSLWLRTSSATSQSQAQKKGPPAGDSKNASVVEENEWPRIPWLFYDEDSDVFGLSSRLSTYVAERAFEYLFPGSGSGSGSGGAKKKEGGDSKPIEALLRSAQLFKKAAVHRRRKNAGIQSSEFLSAVESLMPTFEAFGIAIHAAATKDVLGNVRKLRKNGVGGSQNKKNTAEIAELVVRDFLACNATHPDSTAQAFLWLTRILKFTSRSFDEFMRYPRKSLNACLTSAYEKELGPYHNVVMRSVAVALMQIIPDRQHLLACMRLDNQGELTPHLTRWRDAVQPVIDRSDSLYLAQRDVYYRTLRQQSLLDDVANLPPHRRIFDDDHKSKHYFNPLHHHQGGGGGGGAGDDLGGEKQTLPAHDHTLLAATNTPPRKKATSCTDDDDDDDRGDDDGSSDGGGDDGESSPNQWTFLGWLGASSSGAD